MTQPTFDAAIIDLDGTMVDTMGDFVVAINLMLRELGYDPVARAVVEVRVGKGSENLVKSVLNHASAQQMRAQSAPESIANFDRALNFTSSITASLTVCMRRFTRVWSTACWLCSRPDSSWLA